MIGIVDCNTGNIANVANALRYLGEKVYALRSFEDELEGTTALVLPGVGSFGKFMEKLDGAKLSEFLRNWILDGKQFLGICVGLQVLFERSEESPSSTGLKVLKGEVVKFRNIKIPQIGWNKVNFVSQKYTNGAYYFVNSYYPKILDESILLGETQYGVKFASAVRADNILATQFHPELSGEVGLNFLKRWLNGL